jgi:F0F1-type ATP synthase membrane subunit c/vacuolar-type H+-ATPase subunit K
MSQSAQKSHIAYRLSLIALLTFLYLIFTICDSPFAINPALAQTFDIASMYQVTDSNIHNDDIVVSTQEKGIARTTNPYDKNIFGIYQETPLLVYRESTDSARRAVTRTGDANVNVVSLNGDIKKGDYVTTSTIAGYGMKSTQSGYVIGVALGSPAVTGSVTYQGKQYATGTVKVAIKIEYTDIDHGRAWYRSFDYFNAALFKNLQDPDRFIILLRYLIAGMIGSVAFMIGFFAFARTIAKSVEAIGRNPQATKSIQVSIMLNIVLTITTTLIGLLLVYIVVRI